MSKLDNIKPSHGEEYDVKVLVEGEWVIMGLLNRRQIEELAKAFDAVQENEWLNILPNLQEDKSDPLQSK